MVNMIRCPKGHYYDSSKFMSCPHCGGATPVVAGADLGETVGIDYSANGAGTPPVPEAPKPFDGIDPEKTIGAQFFNFTNKDEDIPTDKIKDSIVPVVGWLVCIEGDAAGKDFRLCAGKNYIGRAADNDIVLDSDRAVSGRHHAIVSFDLVGSEAYCHPGESRELFYLNGKAVYTPTELHKGDVLTVGKTKLIYVPFYGEVYKLTIEK